MMTPHAMWVVLGLVVSLLIRGTSGLGEEDSQVELHKWIAQLSAPEFAIRENAERKLVDAGPLAINRLLEMAPPEDEEVRLRIERLQNRVRFEYQRKLLKNKLAPLTSEMLQSLPGWTHFQEITGDTDAARKLFWQMYLAESRILWQAQANNTRLGAIFAERILELNQSLSSGPFQNPVRNEGTSTINWPLTTTFGAIFFVNIENPDVVENSIRNVLLSLIQRPEIQVALRSTDPAVGPFKMLFEEWLERTNGVELPQKFFFAQQYQLASDVKWARKIISAGQRGIYKPNAFHILATRGNRSDAALLEASLDDTTVVFNWSVNGTPARCLLQDCALAMLWVLHGENPREHGFPRMQAVTRGTGFNMMTIGFLTDADREKAFAEWKLWKTRPPSPAVPVPDILTTR